MDVAAVRGWLSLWSPYEATHAELTARSVQILATRHLPSAQAAQDLWRKWKAPLLAALQHSRVTKHQPCEAEKCNGGFNIQEQLANGQCVPRQLAAVKRLARMRVWDADKNADDAKYDCATAACLASTFFVIWFGQRRQIFHTLWITRLLDVQVTAQPHFLVVRRHGCDHLHPWASQY